MLFMCFIVAIYGVRILLAVKNSPKVDDYAKVAIKRIIALGISSVGGYVILMICLAMSTVPMPTLPRVRTQSLFNCCLFVIVG